MVLLRRQKNCYLISAANCHNSPWTVTHFLSFYSEQRELDAVGVDPRLDLARERKKNALAAEERAKELATLQEVHKLEIARLQKVSEDATMAAKHAHELAEKKLTEAQAKFTEDEGVLQLHIKKLKGQLSTVDKTIQEY